MKTRIAFFLVLTIFSTHAFANTGKEFTTSVIYGTLAGTLVGAASLAFTSSPGDNLNNVARGASYGLYAGILLGMYVTYGVNDTPQQPQDTIEQVRPEPTIYEGTPPPQPDGGGQNGPPQGSIKKSTMQKVALGSSLYPILTPDNNGNLHLGVGIGLLNYQF